MGTPFGQVMANKHVDWDVAKAVRLFDARVGHALSDADPEHHIIH